MVLYKDDVDTTLAPPTPVRVLIVDDEPIILRVLGNWLSKEGYTCTVAQSGLEAMDRLRHGRYDLLISDITMPGMSGIELLEQAHTLDAEMAVIMVTGVDDRSTASTALAKGAYGYVIKPFAPNEVLIAATAALERRRLERDRREYEQLLEARVHERTRDIRYRDEEITIHLMAAAEYRDDETGAHIRRMGQYAAALARALGYTADDVDNLRLAAPMHDIGKIGVPDQILQKPGKLTDTEFTIMKTHTTIGAHILANSTVPLLCLARDIAIQHHERWDGTGYPTGLNGTMIAGIRAHRDDRRCLGCVEFHAGVSAGVF